MSHSSLALNPLLEVAGGFCLYSIPNMIPMSNVGENMSQTAGIGFMISGGIRGIHRLTERFQFQFEKLVYKIYIASRFHFGLGALLLNFPSDDDSSPLFTSIAGTGLVSSGMIQLINQLSEKFHLKEKTNQHFGSLALVCNTAYGVWNAAKINHKGSDREMILAAAVLATTIASDCLIHYSSQCFKYNPSVTITPCTEIAEDSPVHVDYPHEQIAPGYGRIRAHSLGAALAIGHLTKLTIENSEQHRIELEQQPAEDVRAYIKKHSELLGPVELGQMTLELLKIKFGVGKNAALRTESQNAAREALMRTAGDHFYGEMEDIYHESVPGFSAAYPGLSSEQISGFLTEIRGMVIQEQLKENPRDLRFQRPAMPIPSSSSSASASNSSGPQAPTTPLPPSSLKSRVSRVVKGAWEFGKKQVPGVVGGILLHLLYTNFVLPRVPVLF